MVLTFETILDVGPVARLDAFRALNLSRLESLRALKFQSLPDMAREPRESKKNIHVPKKPVKLFHFQNNDSNKK